MAASSRATVRSSRFSPSEGGWSGFGPNPREEEQAQAGVQTYWRLMAEQREREHIALEQQRQQREAERELRLEEHQRRQEEIQHTEFLRKSAEQAAMQDRKLAFEKEAAEVMPHLLRLDPTKPEAQEFIAKTMEAHPNLFISGFAKESVLPQIQSIQKEVEAARKAKGIDDTKTAKETADKAAIAAEVARGGRPTTTRIAGTTIKSAEQVAAEKAAADKKASTPNEATRKQHAVASEKLDNARDQLADTQSQIDAREKELTDRPKSKDGPYDAATLKTKQKELEELKNSAVNWNLESEKHNAVKTALESIHPELSPTYQPPPASTPVPTSTSTVAPPSEPPVPANPNLVPSTTPALASTGEGDGLSSTEMVAGSLDATMDATKPTAVAPPPPATSGVVTPAIPTGQPDAPDATAEPHPFEGKRKFQKSTGKWGTFVNGQFVPE